MLRFLNLINKKHDKFKANIKNISWLFFVIFFVATIFLCFAYFYDDIQVKIKKNIILQSITIPSFPNRTCDISDYGASNDLKTLNTKAINDAIGDCAEHGGGTVYVPNGQWLSGAIHFKSNINLHLEDGAEIIFSTKKEDYLPVVFSRYQGIELMNYSPLIYALNCKNIAITGKGKLIGNGVGFRNDNDLGGNDVKRQTLLNMVNNNVPVEQRIFGNNSAGFPPSFIQFINCQDALIEDVYIENGPFWTVHPIYCDSFTIRNTNINTFKGNTDGIVIDSSRNVLVENNSIISDDDAIALKSGLERDGWMINKSTEQIIIRNNTVNNGHSGVAIGSEMSGSVRNIFIENNQFNSVDTGIRIKSLPGRGGVVEKIYIDHLNITDVNTAIYFTMDYSPKFFSVITPLPEFREIFFSNLDVQNTDRFISINGLSNENKIHTISIDKSKISTTRGVSISNATNIKITDTILYVKKGPESSMDNIANIQFEQVMWQVPHILDTYSVK